MATANVIWIEGKAYSMNHPMAKAVMQHTQQFSAGGSIVPTSGKALGNDTPSRKAARAFRSAESKLNQTEKMLLVLLRARYSNVRIQAIRLELAPACCYTPDFSVWRSMIVTERHGNQQVLVEKVEHKLIFFECKGKFIRDDALVKIKTAARIYPEFDFWMMQWRDNRWTENLMPK